MSRFVHLLLGIEGSAETKGESRSDDDVVGNRGDTAVIDLGLCKNESAQVLSVSCEHAAHLGKSRWVQAVLARDLQPNVIPGLGIPSRLGTCLDLRVDLVVIRGGKDAHVVARVDRGRPNGLRVPDRGRVLGDGGLLDVVPALGTNEEAVAADHGVDRSGRALEDVDEGAQVVVGLLEVQVRLGAVRGRLGQEGAEELALEALGQHVVQLDLGVERVGRRPAGREGEACAMERHQQLCPIRADDEHVTDVGLGRREVHDEEEVMELDTGCFILVFSFELLITGAVSCGSFKAGSRAMLTEPLVEPSWEDLPLTLNVTSLGVVVLTSRLAAAS